MKKQGFTLIELIAVMAAMSIVVGVTVLLIAQVLDFQRDNGEYSDGIRAADRFVAVFRSDVHTYGKPEILSKGETLLRWTTESEMVDYTIQPGGFPDQQSIVRTVYKDGEQIHYETYHLPDRTALRFADGKDSDAGLFALSLWTAPKGTELPEIDELNPFDRTIPKLLEQRIDPKYAGTWRTIVVRY